MSSRKRRLSESISLDEENEDDMHHVATEPTKQLKISLEAMFIPSKLEIRPKPVELTRFNTIHEERRNACIKAVFRYFVFKGTKKEHVNRTMVAEVLAQVDQECKKHVSVVLSIIQPKLLKLTGYQIVPGDAIKGFKKGKREDLYLVNTMLIPSATNNAATVSSLLSILQGGTSASTIAYEGFKFVIFHMIFSGSGQKTTLSEIVRQLSKLDSRFPMTLNHHQLSASGRDSLASIPELGENLMEMLQRLKKEEYITIGKDEADGADVLKNIYEFGPRFYLEVGKRNLLISYFQLLGQPVDETDLKLLTETSDDDEEQNEGDL